MPAFRVVMIREGRALSGRTYTRGALADVARAAPGLRCFADHPTPAQDAQQPQRSVRDLVGYFSDPALRDVVDADGVGRQEVTATLHVLESAGWVADLGYQAISQGSMSPAGFSIDGMARMARGGNTVDGLPVLRSCDLVTLPSAGGRFLKLIGEGKSYVVAPDVVAEAAGGGATIPVPAFVRRNLARGLQWFEDGLAGDGLMPATVDEARSMAAGTVTVEKARRMRAWLLRHMSDLDAPAADPTHADYPSPGVVANALWGGGTSDQAREVLRWLERVLPDADNGNMV